MNHDKELLEYRLVLEKYHAQAQALNLSSKVADRILGEVIWDYPTGSTLEHFKEAERRLPFVSMGLPATEAERIKSRRDSTPEEVLVADEIPQPGDIVLLKIRGWVGILVWILQAINGDFSKWTHAAVMVDGWKVWECQPGGSVFTPWSEYENRPFAIVKFRQSVLDGAGYRTRVPLNLRIEERSQIVDTAQDLGLGIGYGWTTYLYLAAYRLGIRPRWLKARVQNTEHLICSQGADEVYLISGIHLFDDGRMPYDICPGDLARLT